jgi:hypothetical protein
MAKSSVSFLSDVGDGTKVMPAVLLRGMGWQRRTLAWRCQWTKWEAWYNRWKNCTVFDGAFRLVGGVDSVAAVVAHGGAVLPAVDSVGCPTGSVIGIFKDEDFGGARGWC